MSRSAERELAIQLTLNKFNKLVRKNSKLKVFDKLVNLGYNCKDIYFEEENSYIREVYFYCQEHNAFEYKYIDRQFNIVQVYKNGLVAYVCKASLKNYRRCKICGEFHSKKEFSIINLGGKKTMACVKCVSNNLELCSCGEYKYKGRNCKICGSEEMPRGYGLKSYNYVPSRLTLKDTDEVVKTYYGLEIEVDRGGRSNRTAWEIENKTKDNCYVVHDGSLTNGIEIVTVPMTKKYLYNFLDFFKENIIPDLVKKNYNTETNCGLHIHIDRNRLPFDKISNVYKVFAVNEDVIVKLSRRDEHDLSRWSKIYLYDFYDGDTSNVLNIIEDRRDSFYSRLDDKYVGFNVKHSRTYEFRLFKGTMDINIIKGSIELCDYIIHIANSYHQTVRDVESFEFDTEYIKQNYKQLYNLMIITGCIESESLLEIPNDYKIEHDDFKIKEKESAKIERYSYDKLSDGALVKQSEGYDIVATQRLLYGFDVRPIELETKTKKSRIIMSENLKRILGGN